MHVPYAITLCFDDSTEKLMASLRSRLSYELHLDSRPGDLYAPHATLGIFENLDCSNPIRSLQGVALKARALLVLFGGIGLFETPDGFTLFISIIPSAGLLQLHQSF